MNENGFCSEDAAIKSLTASVKEAEDKISAILGKLSSHIRVDGMAVFYNYSTEASNRVGPDVTLGYRVV